MRKIKQETVSEVIGLRIKPSLEWSYILVYLGYIIVLTLI